MAIRMFELQRDGKPVATGIQWASGLVDIRLLSEGAPRRWPSLDAAIDGYGEPHMTVRWYESV